MVDHFSSYLFLVITVFVIYVSYPSNAQSSINGSFHELTTIDLGGNLDAQAAVTRYSSNIEVRHEKTPDKTNCIIGSPDHVHFYLYTTSNPSSEFEIFVGDSEKLKISPFKVDRTIKILIHGFASGYNHSYPMNLKNAYLNTTKTSNVIIVDWSRLAAPPSYDNAVINTNVVGTKIFELVLFLIFQNATTIANMHLIGHSLGSHVAGIVGHKIKNAIGIKIPRISGLDPARPFYQLKKLEHRLDESDASFVDVIHTSVLGLYRTVGHADFYPNQGMIQPECYAFDFACSHSRAHELFMDSVYDSKKYKACKCSMELTSPLPVIVPKTCLCDSGQDSIAFMGDGVAESTRGVFYLVTNELQKQDVKNLQTEIISPVVKNVQPTDKA